MNKLLAFAQKRIPYIPELKPLCDDSISATILMMQMEYWFSSRPEGFYKFLKPCAHERYHVGDSWTEELQFSEHEFRSSFDKIGVRYKSKTQLEQVPLVDDVFQGQYYLSYFDTRKGMTVYLRNHVLIDEQLEALSNGFRVQPIRKIEQVIDSNKDANIQSPEIESFNLRRLKKSISGDEKIQSAYIGTDITTRDYIQTAAESNTALDPKSKIAAAGFEKEFTQEEGRPHWQAKPRAVIALEKKLVELKKNQNPPETKPIWQSPANAKLAPIAPAEGAAVDVKKQDPQFPQMLIGKFLTSLQATHVSKTAGEMVKNKYHTNAKQLEEEIAF